MKNSCCSYLHLKIVECDPNYIPPLRKILFRKNKKGQTQIKLNGKGKWIDAEYSEEAQTLTYMK